MPGLDAKPPFSVLVIEDEQLVRESIADMLALEGLPCLVAEDGAAGLAALAGHLGDVRVVVLDLTMPGMSGEATFRGLRSLDPRLRILITSGIDESVARERFASEPIAGYLQKPYPLPTLVRVVRNLLGSSPAAG
jgi:CheY-like chemotaxis protein